MKYSKGPWHSNSNSGFIYTEDGFNIAQVYGVDTEVNEDQDETMHANAHLIASAPELLDSIVQFVARLDELGEHVPQHLRYAILKAQGGK